VRIGHSYIGQPPIKGTVAGTGGWDKYQKKKIGTVQLTSGRRRITMRPDGPMTRPALLDLRAVELIPVDDK